MDKGKRNLIYLTGFMGSGKSTIAPILANTLGYSFVDIDLEIEKITGKRVSDIFQDQGEQYFREVEHALLNEVSQRHGCVVSMGGGTIANETNLRLVKSSGVLVYLKADAEQIFRRLKFKNDRPLMKTKEGARLSEDELRNRIRILLEAREPFYCQADVTIATDVSRVGVTVDKIVRLVQRLIE
jgi:shikimate kinase